MASLPGMDIYITLDVVTKVLVEISAMGVTIGIFEVRTNQITVVPEIPHDAFLNQEGISSKGIHILPEYPVIVYAHIYTALAIGSNLCLPVSTIGCEWRSELQSGESFAAMPGLNISNALNIGYAYDYATTKLSTVSKGTHELMIGFIIGNKHGSWRPKNVWKKRRKPEFRYRLIYS